MNHKFIPVVSALLVLGMLLSAIPLSFAQTYAIGPSLGVVTIPQDNQALKTGVMILGIDPAAPTATKKPLETDLMAQYKLIITYNGGTLQWAIGTAGPTVACFVYEKDKVNVVADPKSGLGKQGTWENLMTSLVDVSDKFVCKPRWKSPTAGMYESVGVLDVYYTGILPAPATTVIGPTPGISGGTTGAEVGVWIADNIVAVEAYFTAGRSVVWGGDIQDLCTLGWAPGATMATAVAPTYSITKPDGTKHYIWANAMGAFVSCEQLALAERSVLGIPLATGQDPLSTV